MASIRKRAAIAAVLIGVALVSLGASSADAGSDSTDPSSAASTSTTAPSAGTSTETVVKVKTEKNTDDIVRWGGLGVAAILAIALIWFFFVRDRSTPAEE